MPKLTLASRRIESLDYSADDWELFTEEHPVESTAAAAELNATITTAVNAGETYDDVYKKTYAVMRRYAELGAVDSEPLYHLDNILARVFGRERD